MDLYTGPGLRITLDHVSLLQVWPIKSAVSILQILHTVFWYLHFFLTVLRYWVPRNVPLLTIRELDVLSDLTDILHMATLHILSRP